MKLEKEDLLNICKGAIYAARTAGKMIDDCAGAEIDVKQKDTGESLAARVVTEVDLKSEKIILDAIMPLCAKYDLGLLTEEQEDDGSRFEKDYFFAIDPLDGTLPFTEAREGYAVSIALLSREGVPQVGVVYDPLKETLYHAVKECGVYRNEKSWECTFNSNEKAKEIDSGGAVMNACWVLENAPAYFLKNPKPTDGCGCIWDYAATACIFFEFGAWISDALGDSLELNRKDSLFMNHKGVVCASHSTIAKKFFAKSKKL